MAVAGAACGTATAAAFSRWDDVNTRGIVSPTCACAGPRHAALGAAEGQLLGGSGRRLSRPLSSGMRSGAGRRGWGTVVARTSGGIGQPYRPPRVGGGPRRGSNQESERGDGPLMNMDIRVPFVRLLTEDQNMVGVVSTSEALQRSREAELDLVMIASDADPPVVRIMNYSKYRYGMQKKKREAQKKAAANRQVLKELKMRYNIDTHDYAVRQRAAQRFLKSGDKVKVVCQFKGREMEFKDLALKLFQRFQEEIGPMAIVESKILLEGKTMFMVLAPNKAAIQKDQAAAQSQADKANGSDEEKSRSIVDEAAEALEKQPSA